jgi:hypothetical protein
MCLIVKASREASTLLSSRGTLSDPPEVQTVGVSFVMPEMGPAVWNNSPGARVFPLMRFGMTVDERGHARAVVGTVGEMDHYVIHHAHAETRRTDAGRVYIHENEAVCGGIDRHVSGPRLDSIQTVDIQRAFVVA